MLLVRVPTVDSFIHRQCVGRFRATHRVQKRKLHNGRIFWFSYRRVSICTGKLSFSPLPLLPLDASLRRVVVQSFGPYRPLPPQTRQKPFVPLFTPLADTKGTRNYPTVAEERLISL